VVVEALPTMYNSRVDPMKTRIVLQDGSDFNLVGARDVYLAESWIEVVFGQDENHVRRRTHVYLSPHEWRRVIVQSP
jgi:hypothetical protein